MFFLDYKGLDNFGLHYQGSHFIDASEIVVLPVADLGGGGGKGACVLNLH